jgi:hypothetical protein
MKLRTASGGLILSLWLVGVALWQAPASRCSNQGKEGQGKEASPILAYTDENFELPVSR